MRLTRTINAVQNEKVGCIVTFGHITAFLHSDWLHFICHGINPYTKEILSNVSKLLFRFPLFHLSG